MKKVEQTKEKTMFTAKEAVTEYFQGTISYTQLLRDFHQGLIPGKKVSAKKILFRKEALDKWFEEGAKTRENVDRSISPIGTNRKIYKVNMF